MDETLDPRRLRPAAARARTSLPAAHSAGRGRLLRVARSTTLAYCAELGLALVEDPSNQSRAYTRNRVRLDLLPVLEALQSGHSRPSWRARPTWRPKTWRRSTRWWPSCTPRLARSAARRDRVRPAAVARSAASAAAAFAAPRARVVCSAVWSTCGRRRSTMRSTLLQSGMPDAGVSLAVRRRARALRASYFACCDCTDEPAAQTSRKAWGVEVSRV